MTGAAITTRKAWAALGLLAAINVMNYYDRLLVFLIGWLSDALEPHFGAESLRLAMSLSAVLALASGLLFLIAWRATQRQFSPSGACTPA